MLRCVCVVFNNTICEYSISSLILFTRIGPRLSRIYDGSNRKIWFVDLNWSFNYRHYRYLVFSFVVIIWHYIFLRVSSFRQKYLGFVHTWIVPCKIVYNSDLLLRETELRDKKSEWLQCRGGRPSWLHRRTGTFGTYVETIVKYKNRIREKYSCG